MSDDETLTDPFSGNAVGKFFEVVERQGKNFKVKCKLCLPAKKIISTAVNSNANLKKHVQVIYFCLHLFNLCQFFCA